MKKILLTLSMLFAVAATQAQTGALEKQGTNLDDRSLVPGQDQTDKTANFADRSSQKAIEEEIKNEDAEGHHDHAAKDGDHKKKKGKKRKHKKAKKAAH